MPVVQELTTWGSPAPSSGLRLDCARCVLSCPAHLSCMGTTPRRIGDLEPIYSLSELAAHLGVPQQTLYDLRHQGRGPRGFRVGRELRFRAAEVRDWLAEMEAQDAVRQRPDTAR